MAINLTPGDWLRKRNKNKQVNTTQQTRYGQARKRSSSDPTTKTNAMKTGRVSAGRSVKAMMKKVPTPSEDIVPKESNVNPNRMQGGNTSRLTTGDYAKALAYQKEVEYTAPVKKPAKSGFDKFVSKTKGAIKSKIKGRRYNLGN